MAPLSIWVTNHLLENLIVLSGDANRWQNEVTDAGGPVQSALVTVFVLAPLVLHTIWGIKRIKRTRPNNGTWNTFENLRFLLQRISAVGVLLFLGAHLFLARIQPFFTSDTGHISLTDFAAHMQQPETLAVYLLGTLGVTYHLSNGLWGFAIHMGFYQGPRAQERLRNVSVVIFVVLLAMAWGAIFGVRAYTAP